MESMKNAPLAEPLRLLLSEHDRQRRLLALFPRILARQDPFGRDEALLLDGISHARRYGDEFHHAKEEGILFPMPLGSHPFIQAMTAEHATARDLLDKAGQALHGRDQEGLAQVISRYVDLMRQHMRREDDVLFPWFQQALDEDSMALVLERFDKLDTKLGSTLEGELDAFIEAAEIALAVVHPVIHTYSVLREKTVERLFQRPEVAISHMILPAGESVEGHRADTDVYFIITHGMVTVRHSDTQQGQYIQGTVVHFPAQTWLELHNEGPGTFEMFAIRAPNP
jgi:hemerythrin-like domain-containing protein/quercetin dioxygenase-like cupin family protein